MSTLALVIVVMGSLLILVGILRMIDWYKVFQKYYGDNPIKARVYVEYGEKTDPVEGKLYGVLENSAIYEYTWAGVKQMVVVKHDYPWRFIYGRRIIRVLPGKAFSQPIKNLGTQVLVAEPFDQGVSPDLGGARELDVTIRGQTQIELVKSIKGRKSVNFAVGMVVIVAVVVGVYFFWQNMNKEEPLPPQPSIEEMIEGSQ